MTLRFAALGTLAVRGVSLSALATALLTGSAQLRAQAPAPAEAVPASAQPGGAEPIAGEPGDIIVTALKGGVSVQRAPVTVNVVSGVAIADKGVTSVEQLTAVVPGVRINQAPGGLINPVVRGLGSSPSNNSFEQTVGLFVDGMFAGHPRDYAAALFDLDRVELLKGTQSAIVGKNTSVGALSVITRKPSFELGAEGSYYHEFELGTDTVNASVNVPLSDTLALRVAGLYSDEGGWMKAVLGGNDQPEVKRRAVRATLRFKPNADLDWTISGQYSKQGVDGQYFRTGIDTLGTAARGAALGGDLNFVPRRYETRNNDRPNYTFRGLDHIGTDDDGTRFNSTINYSLGAVTLTSVTGYSEYKDLLLLDAASTINSPALRGGYERDKAFSQELRLSTDPQKPLSIIAGAYYYHDKWFFQDQFDFNAAQLTAPPLGGAFRSSYLQTTETVSLFGQALYKITDRLQLSGSLRYEHFSKDGDYSSRVVLRPGGLTAAVYGAYPAFSRSGSRNYIDYSGQAQYFFTPKINAYASYSTGTKGFGYVATPSSPGGVVTNPFFRTEQSETAEAGIKSTLAPGSTLNVAIFNTRLKDYQIGVNLGTSFLVRNDQVRSRGVEATMNLAVLDGLHAVLTATYADVTKRGPLPANSISGLPFAPRWSGLASLSYEAPLGSTFRLHSEVDAEFRSSEKLSDLANFVIPKVPGRVRTDLRIGLEHRPTKIELAVIVRNIFNVYSLNYAFNQFGSTGAAQVAEDMPRTIGLQLSFRY